MRLRISIRGHVRPSVRLSVRPVLFSNDEKRHFLMFQWRRNLTWTKKQSRTIQKWHQNVGPSVCPSIEDENERKWTISDDKVVASFEPRGSCYVQKRILEKADKRNKKPDLNKRHGGGENENKGKEKQEKQEKREKRENRWNLRGWSQNKYKGERETKQKVESDLQGSNGRETKSTAKKKVINEGTCANYRNEYPVHIREQLTVINFAYSSSVVADKSIRRPPRWCTVPSVGSS